MNRKARTVVTGLLCVVALLLVMGCGEKRVTRVSAQSQTDLSGRWNDTDSQQVAQTIVTDCLGQPWLDNWNQSNGGKKPVVIIGKIINKSHEHINVTTFTEDISRALINAGKVRFVSSRNEREDVRDERMDQHQGHTAEETRAGVGQEIGADFIMQGTVNTIVDELGKHKAIWYQVNVKLHNVTTNEIVWLGQHKIKKVIDKASSKW